MNFSIDRFLGSFGMTRGYMLISLFLGLWGGLSPGAFGAAEDAASTRQLLEKWIETKRLISKEKLDWRTARELMLQRTDLLEKEIEALKDKTKQTEKDIGEGIRKLEELEAENEELKAATTGLKEVINGLESRLLALLDRVPTPIRERVKPLSQRIPGDPSTTKMSLSERFQNVIGILNEMNKFHREITVASEVRELPDGSKAEVSVLYLGLGQAYYCNAGGIGGIGRLGPDGWTWINSNDIAQTVSDAIAVYRNEKAAQYLLLPLDTGAPHEEDGE